MSTSDESGNFVPPTTTARMLLNLLQELPPEQLDLPIGVFDSDYAGYYVWDGYRLTIEDDMVCLDVATSPEMDEYRRKAFEHAEAAHAKASAERLARQVEGIPEELRRFLP